MHALSTPRLHGCAKLSVYLAVRKYAISLFGAPQPLQFWHVLGTLLHNCSHYIPSRVTFSSTDQHEFEHDFFNVDVGTRLSRLQCGAWGARLELVTFTLRIRCPITYPKETVSLNTIA